MLVSLALLMTAASPPPTGSAVMTCRVLLVSRQPGEIVEERDTAMALCPERGAARRLRLDARRGAVVAAEPIGEGDELGRVYFPPHARVRAGDRIRIVARIGRVAVARDATALQPARTGEAFFVRADDGSVFVAPHIGREAVQ